MSNAPLMPMATAVWLVENTTLTFKQIADFCKLHEVEIQGIADGEVAKGIKGTLDIYFLSVFSTLKFWNFLLNLLILPLSISFCLPPVQAE